MPIENVRPDGDSTPLQWTMFYGTIIPPNHYRTVDEGTSLGGHTPNDNDGVQTSIANNADRLTLGNLPGAAHGGLITQVDINYRGTIDDDPGETDSYIELRLYHSGTTEVTGNPKTITSTDLGGQDVIAEVTKSWTGLALTRAQADSLEIQMKLIDPS